MADSQQTEKATPHRLKKAREKGDFPATREFVAAFQFLGFVIIAAQWFPDWLRNMESAMQIGLRRAFSTHHGAGGGLTLTSGDLLALFTLLARTALTPLAVLGGVLLGLTLLFQMASNGAGLSLAKLTPDFNRLNPMNRLKDLPGTNLGHFFQAIIMLPVMFWLTWLLVRDRLPELLRLPLLPVASGAAVAGALIHDALRRASFVLALLGAVVLIRERARYAKRLRMSKQEVRDEAKELDGNPQIKARVRRIQRDLLRRSMMKEVPTATAVIVNPTHYAVALRYEQGSMAAPKVVAKGRNYLAARIRQRAIENQVPIIENPPLAQALYKTVDLGQDIPPHLYRAVAEILAYIFRIMGRAARA
jgi:flagellar biosynthetic protein FlhB